MAFVPDPTTGVPLLDTEPTGAAGVALEARAAILNAHLLAAAGEAHPIGAVAGLPDALLSAAPLDLRRSSTRGRSPRVPTGVKLCGVNIAPSPDQVTSAGTFGAGGWRRFWVEWDWSGPRGIKYQIDKAKSLNLNAVRIIGNTSAVVLGQHSQADLVAKYDQVIAYCRSLGMYYYVCLGGSGDWEGATTGQIAPVMAAVAAAAAKHPNVIGIDVIQEFVYGFPTGDAATIVADYVAPTHAAVSAACGLPLTYSLAGGNTDAGMWNHGSIAAVDPYCDFFDGHPYYTGTSPTEPGLTSAYAKHIVIGECGANQSMSSADRAARYRFFRSLCERPDVVGGFAWTLLDQHTDPAINWGILDGSGDPRAEQTDVLATFPRVPRPFRDEIKVVGTPTFGGAGYEVPAGLSRGYWLGQATVARIGIHAHIWNDSGGDSVFNLQVRVNASSAIGPGLTVPMRSGETWRMVSWFHADQHWVPGLYTVEAFCGRVSGGGVATLQADTKLSIDLTPVG